jgi:RsiW-degrading membrane proteinase PrsW (M82 family)
MGAFLLALALSFIPAFFYAMIVYWLDRFEKEPRRLLVGAFLWGAFVATTGAIIFSLILQAGVFLVTESELFVELTGTTVIAPLVEESLKGLAVLLVFLIFQHEFDSVLDGMVYAAITALGFAATENVLYLLGAYMEGGIGDMLFLFVLRVILGGWGHAVYTAFIGIGLAIARLSPNFFVSLVAPIVGWMIAVALHALHNAMAVFLIGSLGLGGLAATLLVDWTTWAIAFAVVIWEIRRERRWIVTYLEEEVEQGTLSLEQYHTARSVRAQFQARAQSGSRRRQTNRFYELCAELAQKKRQFFHHGEERGNSATIEKLRAELRELSPVAMAVAR